MQQEVSSGLCGLQTYLASKIMGEHKQQELACQMWWERKCWAPIPETTAPLNMEHVGGTCAISVFHVP